MQTMSAVDELRGRGRMTWMTAESGWVAAPDEIVSALSTDGFEACKQEITSGGRDGRPAGGLWQGLNTRTGAVASAIWVNRLQSGQAMVFITVDGELLQGEVAAPEPNPCRENGGGG